MSSTPLTEVSLDRVVESLPLARPRDERSALGPHAWRACFFAVDAAMIVTGSLVANAGARRAGLNPVEARWTVGFGALLLALLALRGLYRQRLQAHLLDDLRDMAAAVTVALGLTVAAQAAAGTASAAQGLIREWAFVAVYALAGRTALEWAFANARRAGRLTRRTLIVGRGHVGSLVARRLLDRPELGLVPVGFLDKEPLSVEDAADVPTLGASWDLERVVEEQEIRQVIVAFSTAPDEVMLRLLRRCEAIGVDVAFVPRFFEQVPEALGVEHLGGLSLLVPRRVDPNGWKFAVKYAADRVVAGVALLLVSPLFAAAAAAVRLTMGRPVFFRQTRVGLDGRPFEMLKFRSMREPPADAPAFVLPEGLGPGGVEGVDRTTRVGRLLRATSIDELPQLINVARGEMSLVGPRPERPEFVGRFERSVYRYGDRHRVKAGITGWAQVHGLRGRTSIADRAEWDNFYIENFSLWLDVKILLLTAAAVVRMLLPVRVAD